MRKKQALIGGMAILPKVILPFLDIFFILLSGAFLTLVFPGFEMHFLAWVALVPLFLLIKKSGPLKAFLCSLALGVLFYGGLLWWIVKTPGLNPFNFGLGVLLEACSLGSFGLIAYYVQKRMPQWNALTFPAAWTIIEYLKSHFFFLSLPWGILGYSQYSVLPVARFSAFAGVYGVSFLIVSVNAALSEILPYFFPMLHVKGFWQEPARANLKISLCVLGGSAVLISASFLYQWTPLSEGKAPEVLNIAVIQGNMYSEGSSNPALIEKVFQKYHDLTTKAAESHPDLIVWPESAVPGRIPYDGKLLSMLTDVAQKTGAFLLTGTAKYDKISNQKRLKRTSNSAVLFSPLGQMIGQYDKILLLPFNEYIPLRGHIKWPVWIASSDSIDYEPGRALTIFRVNNASFGVQICWENLFPDQFREMAAKGVDFTVSMTNEAFTEIPAAHYQSLAMNVFRAIENHVSIVRTSTSGVSCIIGPDGRVGAKVKDQQSRDVNVDGYLVSQMPLSSKRTFYNRHGDLFVYILFGALTGFILRNIISHKKIN